MAKPSQPAAQRLFEMHASYQITPCATAKDLASDLRNILGAAVGTLENQFHEGDLGDQEAHWAPLYLLQQCIGIAVALEISLMRVKS